MITPSPGRRYPGGTFERKDRARPRGGRCQGRARGKEAPRKTWIGYILAANGAQLPVLPGEQGAVTETTMPPSLLPRMKAMADAYDLTMICYDEHSLITDRPDDPIVAYEAQNDSMSIRYARTARRHLGLPRSCWWAEDKVEACRRSAEAAFAGNCTSFVGQCFLEFRPGVSKETGLMQPCTTCTWVPKRFWPSGTG